MLSKKKRQRHPLTGNVNFTYLNIATFINNCTACGSSFSISDTGRSGIRIDFSCTWNESRKNASEVLTSAYPNLAGVGEKPR